MVPLTHKQHLLAASLLEGTKLLLHIHGIPLVVLSNSIRHYINSKDLEALKDLQQRSMICADDHNKATADLEGPEDKADQVNGKVAQAQVQVQVQVQGKANGLHRDLEGTVVDSTKDQISALMLQEIEQIASHPALHHKVACKISAMLHLSIHASRLSQLAAGLDRDPDPDLAQDRASVQINSTDRKEVVGLAADPVDPVDQADVLNNGHSKVVLKRVDQALKQVDQVLSLLLLLKSLQKELQIWVTDRKLLPRWVFQLSRRTANV